MCEKLFEARYRRRYDARLQLMAYQIQMLQSRIDTDRIYTRPEERAELTRLGAELGHDINDAMLVVQPATCRGWLRPKEIEKPQKPGRPETPQATVNLIMNFSMENLTWGYERIQGELKKLGIRIGITTISDILKREGIHPVPDKQRKYQPSNCKLFLNSHMDTLVATDFPTKPVLTWRGWMDSCVLVFIHLGSRRVFMSPSTFNPTEDWVLQQARNASMWLQDLSIQAFLCQSMVDASQHPNITSVVDQRQDNADGVGFPAGQHACRMTGTVVELLDGLRTRSLVSFLTSPLLLITRETVAVENPLFHIRRTV